MSNKSEQFLNPSKITEDIAKRLKSFSVPGVDVEAVMATQRQNIEALANASRSALDGAHAVGKRQAEILQETLTQTTHSLESMTKGGSQFDIAARQTELMKQGFEKALGNMCDLAKMVSTAQVHAVDAMSDRVVQSLNELKQLTLNPIDAPATKPLPTSAAAAAPTH